MITEIKEITPEPIKDASIKSRLKEKLLSTKTRDPKLRFGKNQNNIIEAQKDVHW